jgi:DNA-binding NarL/FixJ family response regulator
MIRVCLIGSEIEKEHTLLSCQSQIHVTSLELSDMDTMLNQMVKASPDMLVLSDINNQFDVDDFCLHAYLRMPTVKTLIVTEHDFNYARLEKTGFSCRGFMPYEQRHAIVRAVNVIHEGESWLSRKLVTELLDQLTTGAVSGFRQLQLVKNN